MTERDSGRSKDGVAPSRRGLVITGGPFHDMDFVTEKIRTLAQPHVDTIEIAHDFSPFDAAVEQDWLVISYTNNVFPTASQLSCLRGFLENGGRWVALHASGAFTEFVPPPFQVGTMTLPGRTATPDKQPEYMDLLGCRMRSHLPVREFEVEPAHATHEVVRGLTPFMVTDEPFILELRGEVTVLLSARYKGKSGSYLDGTWLDDAARPQLLIHDIGRGAVAYCSLGHCRGPHDMRPYADTVPPMRGAWDSAAFITVLSRLIVWAGRGNLNPVGS